MLKLLLQITIVTSLLTGTYTITTFLLSLYDPLTAILYVSSALLYSLIPMIVGLGYRSPHFLVLVAAICFTAGGLVSFDSQLSSRSREIFWLWTSYLGLTYFSASLYTTQLLKKSVLSAS